MVGLRCQCQKGAHASVVGAGFADDKRFIQDTLDAHNSLTRQDGDFLFFLGFEAGKFALILRQPMSSGCGSKDSKDAY